jgi:hypothetical protein
LALASLPNFEIASASVGFSSGLDPSLQNVADYGGRGMEHAFELCGIEFNWQKIKLHVLRERVRDSCSRSHSCVCVMC